MSGRRLRNRVESAGALVLILALGLTAGVVCPASAQSLEPGRLTGRVTDVTGFVLPGVQVTLTADDGVRTVVTREDGGFAFEEVTPNTAYTIRAELRRFGDATLPGLVLAPGQAMTFTLSLRRGCLEWGPPLYAQPPAIDQLLDAEMVAHVRITEDSYEAQIGTRDGDCPDYAHHASATVLQVATSRGLWPTETVIDVSSPGRLAAGAEYVAFLSYESIAGRYTLGEPYIAFPVVSGRVESSWEGSFGFRDGAPVGRALAGIRETHAHHTRYRPLGKEGAEAPLDALRYKTGWFLMGGIQASGERWVDLYAEPVSPMERPFDFVREPQSSRQLPRRGDRVRLTKGGTISIVNFGSRGEALRDRPPTHDNYDASTPNVTGTRVDAGGVYDVGDVVLESNNGTIREVWVRLVAVRNSR